MSAWHSPKRKRYKGSHQDLGDAMVELTKVVALAMNTAPPTESDLDRQLNEAKIKEVEWRELVQSASKQRKHLLCKQC